MRDLTSLDDYRIRSASVKQHYGSFGDETCGVFGLQYPATGVHLRIVASSAEGWDHVSVSLPNRCPNWPEMDFVKRKFFHDNEIAMQLHVGAADHISIHPNCLHLWRPHREPIPLPPKVFV